MSHEFLSFIPRYLEKQSDPYANQGRLRTDRSFPPFFFLVRILPQTSLEIVGHNRDIFQKLFDRAIQ